ncbi:serine/threonine-protein kinase PknH/PknJ [Mycobacterium sp. ZZG]
MALSEGQIFAGYRILRQLGSGGMGEVYLAQHPRLPRHDALKLLPPEWSADAEYRARFTREADLASTLWHPNVVGVHDRGEADGQLWISMDFVDGHDAAKLLAQRYPAGMPVDEVARIVSAVASALDAAHKRGLLHRDVKPANIMLTHVDDDEEQRVLLTDFGIARNANDISGLTATNMTVGTVAYCAPEQLLGEDVDGRADQYALAATAYHLVTGAPLFVNSNPAVVISRHLNSAPPALADYRPELAKFDAVLAAGLAKQPADRFERCSDFARAFSEQVGPAAKPAAAATAPAAITRPKPATAEAESNATATKGSHWVWPTVAIGAIIVVVGGVLLWRPWHSQTSANPSRSDSSPTATASAAPPVRSSLVRPVPPPPPPPPPTFPASNIDSLLLTPEEITSLTGGAFTGDPPNVGSVELVSSSQGTSDNARTVDPPACAGVIYGAEQQVYENSGFEAIRNQTLGKTISDIDDLVEQTAVVFPTAEAAQAIVDSSTTQWQQCALGHPTAYSSESSVDQDLGYERGFSWYFTTVTDRAGLITLRMSAVDNLNGSAPACQVAMGSRDNVVIKVKTCFDTDTNPRRSDPAVAGDYAERIASTMRDRVIT